MANKIISHIPSAIIKLHSTIFPIAASGSWIIDKSRKRYLDLTSGIGALSTGHNHQYTNQKVIKQLNRIVHVPQQVFGSHPAQLELTEKLINIMPDKSLDTIFYVSSGSEATDNAIKIARRYTNKTNIIAMLNGFHGRSLGALSITSSNTSCKLGLQPLMPGCFFCPDFTRKSIDNILSYNSSPDETAAIIVEPILGEAGVIAIPSEFMRYLQKVCNENNIMLIADEVQCGAGRTGVWWSVEHSNVVPDIMTIGKGIAGGFPLAGVVSRSEIMNSLNKGCLGGTYGGNAISSAAASATIDIITEEKLLENAKVMGDLLYHELATIPSIIAIRQYGLMVGIALAPGIQTADIVARLREKKILVLTAGLNGCYIRLLPSLNVSREDILLFTDTMRGLLA
jgi:4-aminobutyrate aminotransferase